MWKWLVGSIVGLALLCGGGGFFLTSTPTGRDLSGNLGFGGKRRERATEVRLEPVERGQVTKVVSAPGTIEPRTSVEVSAQVSAKIVALPFREGDQVKAGDVVVRLDAEDYQAALESARASMKGDQARLQGLRAELVNAELEFHRARGLYETKDIPKSEFDQAEAAYLRAQASVLAGEHAVEVAESAIVRAQKNLEFTTIRAPMDGTIILLNNEVGEQVLGTFNNAGSVIMEIADLSTMIVKAKIDEINIVPVRAQQPAAITINGFQDRTFQGSVDLVGLKKQIDKDGTGYFETEVLVKHTGDDALRSGSNGNVDITVETFKDVLKVPSQAVVDRRVDELPSELVSGAAAEGAVAIDRNKTFARIVYVYEDGKAVARPVSIGPSDMTHTMIVAGLKEGDRIITGPYRVLVSLKDGQSVAEEGTTPDGAGSEPGSGAGGKSTAGGGRRGRGVMGGRRGFP